MSYNNFLDTDAAYQAVCDFAVRSPRRRRPLDSWTTRAPAWLWARFCWVETVWCPPTQLHPTHLGRSCPVHPSGAHLRDRQAHQPLRRGEPRRPARGLPPGGAGGRVWVSAPRPGLSGAASAVRDSTSQPIPRTHPTPTANPPLSPAGPGGPHLCLWRHRRVQPAGRRQAGARDTRVQVTKGDSTGRVVGFWWGGWRGRCGGPAIKPRLGQRHGHNRGAPSTPRPLPCPGSNRS